MSLVKVTQDEFNGGMLGAKGMHRASKARPNAVKRAINTQVSYAGPLISRERVKVASRAFEQSSIPGVVVLPFKIKDREYALHYTPWHHLTVAQPGGDSPFAYSYTGDDAPLSEYPLERYNTDGTRNAAVLNYEIRRFLRTFPIDLLTAFNLKTYVRTVDSLIAIDQTKSTLHYNVFSIFDEDGTLITASRSHLLRSTPISDASGNFFPFTTDTNGLVPWGPLRYYGEMQSAYRYYRAAGEGGILTAAVVPPESHNVEYVSVEMSGGVLLYDRKGRADPLVLTFANNKYSLDYLNAGAFRYTPVTMKTSIGNNPVATNLDTPAISERTISYTSGSDPQLAPLVVRSRAAEETRRVSHAKDNSILSYDLPDTSMAGYGTSILRDEIALKGDTEGLIRASRLYMEDVIITVVSGRTGDLVFYLRPVARDMGHLISESGALPPGISFNAIQSTLTIAPTVNPTTDITFQMVYEGRSFNITIEAGTTARLRRTLSIPNLYNISAILQNYIPPSVAGTPLYRNLRFSLGTATPASIGLSIEESSRLVLNRESIEDGVDPLTVLQAGGVLIIEDATDLGNRTDVHLLIRLDSEHDTLDALYLDQVISRKNDTYKYQLILGQENAPGQGSLVNPPSSGVAQANGTNPYYMLPVLATPLIGFSRLIPPDVGLPERMTHFQNRIFWFQKFVYGISALASYGDAPDFNYSSDSPLPTDAFFSLLPLSPDSEGVDWIETYEGNLLIAQKNTIHAFAFGAPVTRSSFIPSTLTTHPSGGVRPVRKRNFLFKVDATRENIERLETQFQYQSQYSSVSVGSKIYLDYLKNDPIIQLVPHPSEYAFYAVTTSGKVFYGYVFSDGKVGWSQHIFPGFLPGSRFTSIGDRLFYVSSEGNKFITSKIDTLNETLLRVKIETLPPQMLMAQTEAYLGQQNRCRRASFIIDAPLESEVWLGQGDETRSRITYKGKEIKDHSGDMGDGENGILIQYEGQGDFTLTSISYNLETTAVKKGT